MPVTFVATSNKNLKRGTPYKDVRYLRKAIESSKPFRASFPNEDGVGSLRTKDAAPTPGGLIVQCSEVTQSNPESNSRCGLISAILTAYNSHLDLVLDPNDVWITILGQFSAYINGGKRAEELRDAIVDFDGKRELTVYAGGTLFTADFGGVALSMVDEISKNIKDPSLREWFLPGFSTSTPTDKICASVACMSALQNYFEYRVCLCCGIPHVTLMGTVDDWILLRSKIERLAEFDLQDKLMTQWLGFLRPICDNFVLSAQGNPNVSFWDHVCCHVGGGSGPSYLSGWITAFTIFSTKGDWQGNRAAVASGHEQPHAGGGAAGSKTLSALYGALKSGKKAMVNAVSPQSAVTFPQWPKIDTNDLNHNQLSVPMTIDDNGTEYMSTLFAGQFIHEFLGDEGHTVRPRNDWAIAIPATDAPKEAARLSHGDAD
mmetsp:Transcript_48118/g.113550  ORF Transcript_48118/g.113550 Transcript_48118/m.113550 type:complete len:431 (+) Transcript_48118:127-1419(+)